MSKPQQVSKQQAAAARTADIWGVLSHFGLECAPPARRVWPGGSTSWTSITQCPICGHELWVDNARQIWMCKTCRRGGDVINLVQHVAGCTTKHAIEGLSGHAPLLKPQNLSKSAKQLAIAKTKHIEDIAPRYGLTLTETTEMPAMTHLNAGWPPRVWGGKNFTTTCPICRGPLFVYVNVDRQLWTCRTCNRGYSSREGGKEGDAIDLVRHLSGCSFNRAVWYLGGGGPQPNRENSK
jgi:uncharacterized protein YbaR (Trm112 family)